MPFTDITIGRLTLRESFDLAANISAGTDTRTLVLAGQESSPPLTFAQVKQRQEDILGLQNRITPIRFGTKSDHDGWYKISDVNTSLVDYQGSEMRAFGWSLNAELIGPENAVDLESRLTGVSRINDFGLSGERWHSVPAAVWSYYGGTSTRVLRATSDGASAAVYRNVGASVNPRWAIDFDDYQIGRCRILDAGVERTGTPILGDPAQTHNWEISNGIVSASMDPGSPTWKISHWDGTAWDSKGWNLGLGSSTSAQGSFAYWSVLRNDYEMVTLRLIDENTEDRTVIDLTIRRGSRFVEGRIVNTSSGTLAVWPATAEAGTSPASSGYVRATSNDANGNRYVVGSARSFSALTASGGLSKGSATSLDFFIGAEVGGSAAQTGDQAANLVAQYLTAMAETTVAARR